MEGHAETAETTWSTSQVGPADAFDYWRDVICDAFVELSARPRTEGPFAGSIRHRTLDGLRLSLVAAEGQAVDRTRRMIARAGEECLLASIQLEGRGRVRQDGREARLGVGSIAFYDSTRPYTLDFDRGFRQLVVQVPKAALSRANAPDATAVALGHEGPARLVSDFFVAMFDEPVAPEQARLLAPHALGLLDLALGVADGSGAASATGRAAGLAEVVRRAVTAGALDPQLDADGLAAACHVSRRTLFRVLAEQGETFTGVVRAERVRRAAAELRAHPGLALPLVAARSGFLGEAQLHRAFRRELGTTPGAFRSSGRPRPPREIGPHGQDARPASS